MSDTPMGDMPGMPDMGSLLAQAQAMTEKLMAQQEEVADVVVEGQAGGGAVKIEMSGAGEFISVKISPDAVDPSDVEMLEDLVLAALNNAAEQVAEQQPDLDSLGLGGMGGLGGLLGGGS